MTWELIICLRSANIGHYYCIYVDKQEAEAGAARLPQPSVRLQLPSATFDSLRRAAHEGSMGLLVVWNVTTNRGCTQTTPTTTW